jgi:hypothetical protein
VYLLYIYIYIYIYIYLLPIYISVRPLRRPSSCHKCPWISLLFLNITFFRVWPSLLKKLFSVAITVIDASLIYQLPWPRSQCVKALTRDSSQSGAYGQQHTTRASNDCRYEYSLRASLLMASCDSQDWLSKCVIWFIDWSIDTTAEQLSHFDQPSGWQLRELLIFMWFISRRCQYVTVMRIAYYMQRSCSGLTEWLCRHLPWRPQENFRLSWCSTNHFFPTTSG